MWFYFWNLYVYVCQSLYLEAKEVRGAADSSTGDETMSTSIRESLLASTEVNSSSIMQALFT